VGEHPVEHTNLGKRREDGSGQLQFEEKAGWDAHVDLTKFEIRGKLESLSGCDLGTSDAKMKSIAGETYVAIGDEDHVCDGTTGKQCAAKKLADEIQATLLIGDGLNNADRNEEHAAEANG